MTDLQAKQIGLKAAYFMVPPDELKEHDGTYDDGLDGYIRAGLLFVADSLEVALTPLFRQTPHHSWHELTHRRPTPEQERDGVELVGAILGRSYSDKSNIQEIPRDRQRG